jgi:hypothetical protein
VADVCAAGSISSTCSFIEVSRGFAGALDEFFGQTVLSFFSGERDLVWRTDLPTNSVTESTGSGERLRLVSALSLEEAYGLPPAEVDLSRVPPYSSGCGGSNTRFGEATPRPLVTDLDVSARSLEQCGLRERDLGDSDRRGASLVSTIDRVGLHSTGSNWKSASLCGGTNSRTDDWDGWTLLAFTRATATLALPIAGGLGLGLLTRKGLKWAAISSDITAAPAMCPDVVVQIACFFPASAGRHARSVLCRPTPRIKAGK